MTRLPNECADATSKLWVVERRQLESSRQASSRARARSASAIGVGRHFDGRAVVRAQHQKSIGAWVGAVQQIGQ